jgi:hypothetical protein
MILSHCRQTTNLTQHDEQRWDLCFQRTAARQYDLAMSAPFNESPASANYELVSPQSFTMPPVGQKMAPLQVVLKRTTGAKKPAVRLAGRVVDETVEVWPALSSASRMAVMSIRCA